ncbi:MAG: HIT family protein [Candidatus Doudnabacteria bacterium]|nr:HIT family protein [Candidatus Doudnabacteria bacterium]
MKIKEYPRWVIHLSPFQCYLGWCDISLGRHLEDLFEVSSEEWKELFLVTGKLKSAVQLSFQNDIFNYSSLGNRARHLHLHVIPRYRQAKEFDGVKFTDARWGRNYSPYDKSFQIAESTKDKIIETIRKGLPDYVVP